MKKNNKQNSTREVLLDQAQTLMMSKGYSGTSVEEICKASKVTKGSFFHYFDSKDDLAQVLLERFCCSSQEKHKSFTSGKPDPLQKLYAYLDGLIHLSKNPQLSKGCLLGTFAQELSDSSPKMRNACCEGFDRWAASLAGLILEVKKKYAPKKSVDPKELADYFIALLEGSFILAKSRGNRAQIEKNIVLFKKYLQTLFGV